MITTIQELKECRGRQAKVEWLNEEIERLRSAMENTTQVLSMAPGGGAARDKLSAQIGELMELMGQRNAEVIRLERKREEVEKWLSTLPEQQAKVMRLRYVDGMSWKKVAQRAVYTPEYCRKINCMVIRNLDTQ